MTGKLGKKAGSSCAVYPQNSAGGGIIIAGEIANDGASGDMQACVNKTSQKWAVGPGGITSGTSRGWWCLADSANSAYFYPYTNDFTVSAMTCLRESFGHYELNTTGWSDSLPHIITLDAGFSDNGQLFIAGTGKVVVNHVPVAFGGKAAYSGNVTVQNSATLAINAGKRITTGAISFATGTTLALPQTGTVTMGGNLTLAAGTTIAYTLSAAGQTTLDVTGKTLTLPAAETDPVVVSLGVKPNAAVRSKTPYTLISGANLTEDDLAKFTLGANPPEWVRGENALVVEDGDLKLYTMNPGLCIKIK